MRDSQADITKAQALLGYEPTVSLEEGLRRTRRLVSHHAQRRHGLTSRLALGGTSGFARLRRTTVACA